MLDAHFHFVVSFDYRPQRRKNKRLLDLFWPPPQERTVFSRSGRLLIDKMKDNADAVADTSRATSPSGEARS